MPNVIADVSRWSDGACFVGLTTRGVLTSLTRLFPVALCDGRCCCVGARGDVTTGIVFRRASFTENGSNCAMSSRSGLATVATRLGDVISVKSSAFVAESDRDARDVRQVLSRCVRSGCVVTFSSDVAEDDVDVEVDDF